jgi:hypothetical protein
MAKKYDVVASLGKYTDAQGNEKTRYLNCGLVVETENGLSMKLNAIPVGNEWNGWFNLFEPNKQESKPAADPPKAATGSGAGKPDDFDDFGIPF